MVDNSLPIYSHLSYKSTQNRIVDARLDRYLLTYLLFCVSTNYSERNESLFSKEVEFSLHHDAINKVPSLWMSNIQCSIVQVIEYNSVYVFFLNFLTYWLIKINQNLICRLSRQICGDGIL